MKKLGSFVIYLLVHFSLQSIKELKPNRKSKCGVLTFVSNWKEFVQTAEGIFQQTDRRDALDKWYLRLVAAMFDTIPRVGMEHPKTPVEVVKMGKYVTFLKYLVARCFIVNK